MKIQIVLILLIIGSVFVVPKLLNPNKDLWTLMICETTRVPEGDCWETEMVIADGFQSRRDCIDEGIIMSQKYKSLGLGDGGFECGRDCEPWGMNGMIICEEL